jgi:hypothetical protein
MKRLFVVFLSLLGFILTAPTAVEFHPLYLNGKLIGNARNINGIIAVSVADLAKASGGMLTLEDAGLTINGNTLSTVSQSNAIKKIHKEDVALKEYKEYKEQPAIKGEIKMNLAPLFHVNRQGAPISTHLITVDGQKWVPVADFARAFGGTWNPANAPKPNEALHLNFSKVEFSHGILIGL